MKLKTRIILGLILWLYCTIALVLLLTLGKNRFNISSSVYIFSYLISIIVLLTFVIGGIPRLVTYIFYAGLIILFLYVFPEYDLAITVSGAFLILFNPYREIENEISKHIRKSKRKEKLNDKKNRINIYAQYRKDMKQMFYLPAHAKYYQSKMYAFSRKIVPFILYVLATFFSIYRLKSFLKLYKIEEFYWFGFWLYISVAIYILGYIIYIKSFSSGIRTFSILIIPILLFLLYIANIRDQLLNYILFSIAITLSVVIVIGHIIAYFNRVVFIEYDYVDIDTKDEYYANALYEPYIYENNFNIVSSYIMILDKKIFIQKFKKILVYSNLNKFIITGYIVKKNCIVLYTAHHCNRNKQPRKFLKYLSKLFSTKQITINYFKDVNHEFYPETFSNKDNYIIRRATRTGELFKKIGLYNNVYLSIFLKFSETKNLLKFSKEQKISIYIIDENKNIIEARVMIENENNIIEINAKNILLSALFYKGTYLKVVLRYSSTKNLKFNFNK